MQNPAFLAKIKTQVSRIRKNVCVNKKDKPRVVRRSLRRQIEQQINADALRRQFGSELTGTVVTAVCNIKYADKLFIKALRSRRSIASRSPALFLRKAWNAS